ASNAAQIAKDHYALVFANADPEQIGVVAGATVTKTADWAFDMAEKGGANIAELYFAGGISNVNKVKTIAAGAVNNLSAETLAYNVMPGMPGTVNDATLTPLIWTSEATGAAFS